MENSFFSGSKGVKKILRVGNRIPWHYFVKSGIGQSDLTEHAGSYDRALRECGIENYNLIGYSSLIPATAERISSPPKSYTHGAVLEGITAVSTARKDERATAGLISGWVYDDTDVKIGGLVAEHRENFEPHEAEKNLRESLDEMFHDRYPESYKLKDEEILGLESFVPEKKFGTAMVVLGFTDYAYPVLGEVRVNGLKEPKPLLKQL